MRCNLLLQTSAVSLLVTVLYVTPALAQWSNNPNINNAICTAATTQYDQTIVSDGSGGAIVTWEDGRSGNYDIYAQRVSASGVPQWTTNGIPICTATGDQQYPTILSDGSGGAIITWHDSRSGSSNEDIYAQRVNASGAVQWTTDGVAICTATSNQLYPTIVSDGSGGAIITWQDYRSNSSWDIYVQRVNASGAVQWTTDGVAICTATGDQLRTTIVSDGSGGAIITWMDFRTGINSHIYAQRVNASGGPQWTANGVAVCTATNEQLYPTVASDGSGGAIITWNDYRSGSNFDIYAQRVNASGAVLWTTNGVAISTATNDQEDPTIVPDGWGGAIITWDDSRSGTPGIYAQRVNASGAVQWKANGAAICTATGGQAYPTIVLDGSGGAIVTWEDYRNGIDEDIYAQRVNASGAVLWTTNGVAVCTAANGQYSAIIVSDGSGGAIITWQDYRSGSSYDIYAQNVDKCGNLGNTKSTIAAVTDIPNDQGGKVRVRWCKGDADTSIANSQIISYGLWRKIPPFLAARSEHRTMKIMDDTLGVLYDFITSVPAVQSPQYNVVAPTLDDSSSAGTHYSIFLVTAHTSNPNNFYISIADSGYSVDNLPPGAVMALAAQSEAGPSVNVHWNKDITDPDVGYYEVHRSTTDGFTPGPSTKIGQTSDTTLVDASPSPGTVNYYRVITVDIHGNKSTPSQETSVGVPVKAQYSVSDRWNLVSVPLTVPDYSKSALYPAAVSNAFAYQGGYATAATLANGVGYWLKFNGAQAVPMKGLVRQLDSIAVKAGWNLIGSISSPVAVAGLGSIPGGIVASQFFGYSARYQVADSIQPGKGYWVKVYQSGKLILASAGELVPSTRIRIVPDGENPPAPPGEEASNLISGTPNQFALQQNYPNPFNPTTVVSYQLPVASYVILKVHNILGQEVATLINGVQDAGYKSVEFSAANLTSGIYTYRLTARPTDGGQAGTFVEVKKMLMIK